MPFFQQKEIQTAMERVLYIWAIRHPASSYVQGMNDLLTPLLLVCMFPYSSDVLRCDVATMDPQVSVALARSPSSINVMRFADVCVYMSARCSSPWHVATTDLPLFVPFLCSLSCLHSFLSVTVYTFFIYFYLSLSISYSVLVCFLHQLLTKISWHSLCPITAYCRWWWTWRQTRTGVSPSSWITYRTDTHSRR